MEEHPVETTMYSLSDAPPAAADRREAGRTVTLLRVGSITIDGQRELCLIRNVSAGGMMIRAYCDVPIGARVAVELKHGEKVDGTARWAEGESTGIEFDSPVDIIDLLAASEDGPKPRMPRVEISCMLTVREGANIYRVRGSDVSQGGLKIIADQPLPIGAHVIVTLAGMVPIPGVVRWKDGDRHGIAFNKVLPVATLVGWLHEQRERMRAAS